MQGYRRILKDKHYIAKPLSTVLVSLEMEQREGRSAGSTEPETGGSSEDRGTPRITRGRGAQESEEAGMEQMSRMLREAREDDDPDLGGGRMGREEAGMEETGMEEEPEAYLWVLTVREYTMGERERGLCDRERGMAERERAMFDRECTMADRERMSGWGERESSTGGMTPGGRQSGMDR